MIDVNLVTIFLVTFGFCLLILHVTRLASGKNNPPGPWGLPILGHLPLIGKYPPTTFNKWRQNYGDVFRIRMGSWNTVVINGYNAVREAAEMAGDAFSGRQEFASFDISTQCYNGFEGISFATFGKDYLHCRKQCGSALRFITNENKSQSAIFKFISTAAKTIAGTLVNRSANGPTAVDDIIEATAGSIIYEVVYGRCDDMISKRRHVQKQLDLSSEFVEFVGKGNPIDLVPWLQYVMPAKVKTPRRLLQQEYESHTIQVKEHLRSFDKSIVTDVTDYILKFQLDSGCTRERAANSPLFVSIKDLFAAGFETSKTILKWILLYLTAYPDAQTRLQEELDAVVPGLNDVTLDHKHKLPYTMAVIYEALRITSFVPLGVPHSATKDVKFRGFDIAKDTVIFFNLHSINHDPNIWESPEEFRPARLLNQEGKLDSEKIRHIASFGYGRRRCVGERFVLNELFIILATVMQRSLFRKPDGEELDLEPHVCFIYAPKPFLVDVSER